MSILYFQLCYCSTLTSLDNRDTGSTFLYELYGCYWQYLHGRLAGIALKTELAWLRTLSITTAGYYSSYVDGLRAVTLSQRTQSQQGCRLGCLILIRSTLRLGIHGNFYPLFSVVLLIYSY